MLKIDLLPRHFAIARTNKITIALIVIVLLLVMAAWGGAVMLVRSQITQTQADLEKIEPVAQEVERLEKEIATKQGELAPIKAKVDFVEAADKSGAQYWDRYHEVVKWIPAFARITQFSITNPDRVSFNAIVGDTTEAARFVLNLIQSPALQNISISGLPAGVSIEGSGGAATSFSPMAGGTMPGGAPPMPGAEMAMPGMPGMAGGGTTTATGEIQLSITATLTEPVSEPVPPAGVAAPAAVAPVVPPVAAPAEATPPADAGAEE